MSKAGHFFQPAQEQNLLNYEEDDASKLTTMRQDLTLQIENLKNKAKEGIEDQVAKKKKKGQKEPSLPELETKLKDVQDTMYAQERLKVLQKQLSYFKEGNGSLSPQHILDLKDKFFFKGSVGSYIFKLVTGMSATPEAFQYASVNHPQILQMIYYTQILNQMDLAINKLALFKDNEGGNLGQLNLKEYAFLQAQRKETNRLLTELSTNPDLRKSFEEKFPEAFKKTSLKAEQKGAKADKALENGAEEAKEQENKLAVNQKFLKLYKEYTEFSEKDKEQFLFKNLKNILNNAVEICKNQPKEEVKKDDPQFASIESNIKSNVEKIAEDPYAYDHFMAQKNSAGLDILMEAIAYMVPESSISQKNIGGNLSEELANYYWHTYSKDKKESTAASISALENPASMLLENEYTQDTLHVLTESYQGFHNKSLEKFNNLYSVVRKIACDPKAFDALENASKTSPEKKQFDLMNLLINFDHALYTLENQKLQKDTYYKTVNDISQELATYLPTLGGWYKNYSKDPAKEDKGEATKALSEQINALKEKSNKASEIDDKNSQEFIGALKEFIKKVPVNAEDENADIYKSISEALTSPYIAAVIKQPDYLKTILSLADIILAKDKEASNIKPEKLAIISASFSVIIKALQAEQKREEIKEKSIKILTEEKNDVIKNEKIIEKINNQVELLQKKYFSKEKNQKISDADAEKLVQSLQAFYNAFPVTKESRNASHVNNALKDPNLLVVLKNPQILTSFLNLADLIAKNQPLTFDDKIGVSFKDIEKALKTLKAPEQEPNTEQRDENVLEKPEELKQQKNDEQLKEKESEDSKEPEQQLKTEEKDEIPKAENAPKIKTGTLEFYPTDEYDAPPINPSEVEDNLAREKHAQKEKESQMTVDQEFTEQINKILQEHPFMERRSSLQSLNADISIPVQEPVKIKTKKTGFITTIAAWFARLFKKKTAKAPVIDEEDNMIGLEEIGPLEELADEEDIAKETVEKQEMKQVEEPIKEKVERSQTQTKEEKAQDEIIFAEFKKKNDEEMSQKEKEEQPTNDSEFSKIGNSFANYGQVRIKNNEVDKDLEELEREVTQEKQAEKSAKKSKAQTNANYKESGKKTSKIPNNNVINESQQKISVPQKAQKKVPIELDASNLPRSFKEMSNFKATKEMREEFESIQKNIIENHYYLERQLAAKYQPEYYANFNELYKEMINHPTNVLLVKLINLLKCNDPHILQTELSALRKTYYIDPKNPKIDPLLILHLESRKNSLMSLNTIKKGSAPKVIRNYFHLTNLEAQEKNQLNICWSIALSNLLACKGIKISSKLIRTAREENAPLNTDTIQDPMTKKLRYTASAGFYQNQRGEPSSVFQGFQQLNHLPVAKDFVEDYTCVESSYVDGKFSTWDDWFLAKLKEAFCPNNNQINRETPSAMSLANGKHVITILGFDETGSKSTDDITIYIHDSTYKEDPQTGQARNAKILRMTLKNLKNTYLSVGSDPFKYYDYESTEIAYLKEKDKKNKNP